MGRYDVVWIVEGSEEDVLCGRNRRTRQICSPEPCYCCFFEQFVTPKVYCQ